MLITPLQGQLIRCRQGAKKMHAFVPSSNAIPGCRQGVVGRLQRHAHHPSTRSASMVLSGVSQKSMRANTCQALLLYLPA